MDDVRLEIGCATTRRIRLGDQAGKFASDIRQRGQSAEMLAPGVKLLIADRWFGAVIKNEENCRATGDELRYFRQLAGDDTEVESEFEFSQCVDSGEKIRLQTKIRVCLGL